MDYYSYIDKKTVFVDVEQFEPIFYLKKYKLPILNYSNEDWNNYKYIKGLKVLSEEYVAELTDDDIKFKNNKNKLHYKDSGGIEKYISDFTEVFNSEKNLIISSIPSSKMNNRNVVSRVVDSLTASNMKWKNGNFLFKKTKNQTSASESRDSSLRNSQAHQNTWDKNINVPNELKNAIIVVIDDVLTTGSSFYAAREHLCSLGLENIIYFSYGKTIRSSYFEPSLAVLEKKDVPIDGIIFDLDQTIYKLVDDRKKYGLSLDVMETHVYDDMPLFFEIIRDKLKIPYLLVTNRNYNDTVEIISQNLECLYDVKNTRDCAHKIEVNILESNDKMHVCDYDPFKGLTKFSSLYTYEDSKLYELIQYDYYNKKVSIKRAPVIKPSGDIVSIAKEQLKNLGCNRIIGVGNSDTDIIAYNNAGIESAFCSWGNIVEVYNNGGALLNFDSIEQLLNYILESYSKDGFMNELSATILALFSFPGVGPKTVEKILDKISNRVRMPSFQDIIATGNSTLIRLVDDDTLNNINWNKALKESMKYVESSIRRGVEIINYKDDRFPQKLLNEKNKPLIIYAKGNIKLLNYPLSIAVVGTREPTEFSTKFIPSIIKVLVENNVCIISGLAHGVDTIAHQSTVDIKGKTIAVLAHGLDVEIYPKANAELAKSIINNDGLLISTYKNDVKLKPQYLAARDEWQSGISDGIIAIETGLSGGTNITINHAFNQDRPLGMVDHSLFKVIDYHNHKSVQGNIHYIRKGLAIPLYSLESFEKFIRTVEIDKDEKEKRYKKSNSISIKQVKFKDLE